MRALKPGRYEFYDDFNEKARGALDRAIGSSLVLAALIIVFREVFEAGLIVGIVLAVTGPFRIAIAGSAAGFSRARSPLVSLPPLPARCRSCLRAWGRKLFNAAILGIAVMMLTWHNVWMAHHGREIAGEMRAVGQAVADGSKSLLALAIVVGVAVLREGSEVALFLYGVAASDGEFGLEPRAWRFPRSRARRRRLPADLFWPDANSAARPVRHHDAADHLARGRHGGAGGGFPERANWLTPLDNVVWDSGWLLSETSIAGRALHTLIGYTDQPTEMQLLVYSSVLLLTFILMRMTGSQPADRAVAAG